MSSWFFAAIDVARDGGFGVFLCSLVMFCIHAEFRKLCKLLEAELRRCRVSVSVLKRPRWGIGGELAVRQTGSWWTEGGGSSVAVGPVLGPCWGRMVYQKWHDIRGCDALVEQFFRIFRFTEISTQGLKALFCYESGGIGCLGYIRLL